MNSAEWIDVLVYVLAEHPTDYPQYAAQVCHADVMLRVTGNGDRIGQIKLTGDGVESLLEQLTQSVWKTGPSRRVTIDEKALKGLHEGIIERARKIYELEAEVKRLNEFISESVIPIEFDDGSRIFASAVSGGGDYVDGMPRQVRLVARDAEGHEMERQYLQTDERRRG